MLKNSQILSLLKKRHVYLTVLLIFFSWFWFLFDLRTFNSPTSTVVLDKDGGLIGAKIASDGQWRFPHNEEVPEMFENAIVEFEDKHFYYHPGIDPSGICRAIIQNIKKKKIVSGGSTLTMQVIRLNRKNQKRTYLEKLIEIILSIRMEVFTSKKEILALYASNAPFGGNVVGLDAAAWRYFGRSSKNLSLAETATLAVLPNAPSLLFPGRNQLILKDKRNRLIDRLHKKGHIDSLTCALSKQEPVPGKPKSLPNVAPHFLELIHRQFPGKIYKSYLDYNLQIKVTDILEKHHKVLKDNQIHNGGIIIMNPITHKTIVYVGNTKNENPEYASDVDVILAKRSSGSILKPFLYGMMLKEGELLPEMLVADIPTQISGYKPQNNNLSFEGAIPANKALAKSLNVPAVRMLQSFGVERFHKKINLMFKTISKPASHYGLSIILGGAEVRLYDLVDNYSDLVRILEYSYFNDREHYSSLSWYPLDAASIYMTFEAMNELVRPEVEQNWERFTSNRKIAWKTGTSYGNRDAWAIGATPNYVVGVWVGNASGEGRPGISGIGAAAPILFDVFKELKPGDWFSKPYDDMEKVVICRLSGHRASGICEPIDSVWIPTTGLKTKSCPYHKLIHLDKDEKYRVNSDCENQNLIKTKAWFILPPAMEYFYKSKTSSYKMLPPLSSKCKPDGSTQTMELIYPKEYVKIYIPKEIDGELGLAIFEATHRTYGAKIYWHIDDEFIGTTQTFHKMSLRPKVGKHKLVLIDENGETIEQRFDVLGRNK